MKKSKKICVYALGIALYVVLALCIQFPVFENYYLCLGYVAMAVYCYFFGPVAGSIVGCLGVVLYCLLTNGLRGMPGWAIGNIVIGASMGIACRIQKCVRSKLLQQILIALAAIASTAIAMLLVKSGVECVLYAQPLWARMLKNMYAFIADAVILVLSFPLCLTIEPIMVKIFPEIRITNHRH
jgi:uncharacterized membrane protein